MKLAYLDEAGNTGRNLDQPLQPIHMILSLVVDERDVTALHEHLRRTARRHFPDRYDEDGFELHGHDLYSGIGAAADMPPGERVAIYDEVLEGIAVANADVIVRGVEKAGLKRRYPRPYHPHDIALMFTIESIERLARERDCRVLLIADEAQEIQDAALRDLAQYQELGTSWGRATARVDRIIDTIHFVPSHSNPGIQLADCATYIASRIEKIRAGVVAVDDRSARAVERLWASRIEPHLSSETGIWFP